MKIITRLKNSKVFRNSTWIIASSVLQMIIALFVNIIVARYLGPVNYGTLNYSLSIVMFFSAICTLGLDSIIINEIISKPKQTGDILGTSIFMRLISSTLSVIMIMIALYIIRGNDKIFMMVGFIQSLTLLFDAFRVISIWYQSELKSKVTAIISFIVYIGVAIYKLLMVYYLKDVRWFAFANTLTAITTMILLLLVYKIHKGKKLKVNIMLGKKMLKKSYHFILSGIMVTLYSQTDKIMLGVMLNDKTVGLYSAAITIVALWNFIPSAIIQSFRPTIINAKLLSEELYIKRLKQLYSIVLWLGILYALFITVFAKPIILILFGNEYILARTTLIVAIWGCGFSLIGVAREIWLVAENKQKYSKYFSAIGAISNIILNIILIPKLGMLGAGIATLISQIGTGFIIPILFKPTRESSNHILEALFLKIK